ncbi:MAG: protein kinase [Chloroflexi bacterium]|nr:protein kinase [Chloroflexota bacterium]
MTDLPAVRTMGPYQLVSELGRGGMAVVYKAYQASLERYVALKVLAPELAVDPEFVARFRREATTAARFDHPNIVPVYDIGQAEGSFFIAMRLVPGTSLAEVVKKGGPLPPGRALTILGQIASALDYAHGQTVIHRDLKPGNILVEAGDRISLADFGIARVGGATQLTRMGAIAGTPEYMAPEQALGQTVDFRADLYALGIMAYELLAGRVPFQANSGVALLHMQVYQAPPSLRAARPDLPQHVDAAIQRMLSKAPEQRFPSAAAFVAALGGQGAGRSFIPPRARVGGAPPRPLALPPRTVAVPWGTGFWIPAGGAVAALLVVVALLALSGGAGRSAIPASQVDVVPRATAVPVTRQPAPTAAVATPRPPQSPAPTAAPQSTAPPIQTPAPAATPHRAEPANTATPPLPDLPEGLRTMLSLSGPTSDNFRKDGEGILPRYSPEPSYSLEYHYDAGEYVIKKSADWGRMALAVIRGEYEDVSLEAEAKLVQGWKEGFLALTCRAQKGADENSGYRLFAYPGSRKVQIRRKDPEQVESALLKEWLNVADMKAGDEPNRLELRCKGATIEVSVNGHTLNPPVSDGTYQKGLLYIGAGAPQDFKEVVEAHFVDHLAVNQP